MCAFEETALLASSCEGTSGESDRGMKGGPLLLNPHHSPQETAHSRHKAQPAFKNFGACGGHRGAALPRPPGPPTQPTKPRFTKPQRDWLGVTSAGASHR